MKSTSYNRVKLKHVAYIERGGSPRPIEDFLTTDPSGLNWIKIGDTVKGSKYIQRVKEKIRREGLACTRFIKKGSLILSNSMSYGQPYILQIDGCIHDGWLAFSNFHGINQDFLYYSLLSEDVKKQFDQVSDGGVVQNLNIAKVMDTKIYLPDLECQAMIVSYLDKHVSKINDVIDKKHLQLSKFSEYRQSLITQAVTKGLDPNVEMKDSGLNWLGTIPKHWRIATIGRVMNVTLGKMLENDRKDNTYTLESYLCAGSISWDGVKTDYFKKMWFSPKEKEELLLRPGDCLIVEGEAGFGVSTVYQGELTPCYFQNSIIRLRQKDLVTPEYARYWLHVIYNNYLETVCNQATFSHYTKEKVSKTPIVIPPINEQQKIADFLNEKNRKIDLLSKKIQQSIDKIEEYRLSLITAAVTGKIDIAEDK